MRWVSAGDAISSNWMSSWIRRVASHPHMEILPYELEVTVCSGISRMLLWTCLQGVFYTHRSNYLTGLAMAMPDGLSVTASSRILLIVPMFHANAWAIPYAAFAGGASLVLPGDISLRYLVFVAFFNPAFFILWSSFVSTFKMPLQAIMLSCQLYLFFPCC